MILQSLLQLAIVFSVRPPFTPVDEQADGVARAAAPAAGQTLWFNQKISHTTNYPGTYKQRYYVNTDYYKPGGPAFLYLGGESPLGSSSVVRGIVVDMAKANGGIVYGLEHRYYGQSQPFSDHSVESLEHLSTFNGLEDARNFMQKVINPITNSTNKNARWVTVGGSYPGNLSAWLRQKYQTLVYASLASSAPVLAKEDFFEYDQIVQDALGKECFSKIEQIKNYFDIQYENKTLLHELKGEFGCGDIDDDTHFLYVIADMLATLVQYNDNSSTPNINSMCSQYESLTSIDDLVKAHIENMKGFLKNWGQTCLDFSGIPAFSSPAVDTAGMLRQWTYQCCTEYGYWQTAPKESSTRSKYLTADWFNNYFCSEKFYGKKIGPPNTKAINGEFRGLDNYISRVIWTNGNADPWIALSISNTMESTRERPIYVIEKGSHANDLSADRDSDSTSLKQVKNKIRRDINRWLRIPPY